MLWNDVEANFGKILKREAHRRCHTRNNPNADLEDFYQTAALTAWEYCRDKDAEEIDGRVLRNKVRASLYDMAAHSHGIHMPRKVYKRWSAQEVPDGIATVTSLDGFLDLDGDGNARLPVSLHDDGTAFSVAVFVSSLPPDEHAVLAECLRLGRRSEQAIACSIGKPRIEVARTLRSLRKHCREYFGRVHAA